ncbi:MAG: GNAT family N-acetyltransferase [Gammaproteobacteria bacterium]|nr:GNAT family N-acetyltransferase [Gammaproteobacteria bacterium]
MSRFDPRKVPVYRAYRDEIPWDLLPAADIDPDWVRVAKLDGEVIGVYAVHPLSGVEFRIDFVVVAPPHRGQGLGSWLLRHAIGVCETKGAREIVADSAPGTTIFSKAGFKPEGGLLRLRLTPE